MKQGDQFGGCYSGLGKKWLEVKLRQQLDKGKGLDLNSFMEKQN